MILVDTSAWIEFDRATGSATDRRLVELIGGSSQIAATEPVLMEVLAGARGGTERQLLRRVVTSFGWLSLDPTADFAAAAKIYTDCRSQGIAPRNLIVCMIAAVAMRTRSSVLTADRDFAAIATVLPLTLA